MVTVAPEITAPLESVTVPLILPETALWATARLPLSERTNATNNARTHRVGLCDILANCLLVCFCFAGQRLELFSRRRQAPRRCNGCQRIDAARKTGPTGAGLRASQS